MKNWILPSLPLLFLATGSCFAQKNPAAPAESFACPPGPAAPAETGATVCEAQTATLSASAPAGTILWYDTPTGGTAFHQGPSYTTAPLTNSVTYYVEVVDSISSALAFPGGGDWVDCANTSGNEFSLLGDGTIEAWVIYAPGEILGKDEGPGNNVPKWFFGVYGNYMNFHINGPGMGGGHWVFSSGWSAPAGWHHVAMVKTGNNIEFFSNGVSIGGGTLPVPAAPSGASMAIGWGELCCQASGTIDEVRFYNVARTAGQIAASMNTCADPGGLLAYYPMNDMPGQSTIADHSGGGHTGNIHQAIWVDGYDLYCFAECFGTSSRVPVTATVVPNPLPAIVASPPAICASQTATLDAGAGFSAYQWSVAGQTGQTLTVTSPGTYSITVSNASGCTGTDSETISSGSASALSTVVADETCGLSNGSIDLTATGGSLPYTFNWSNGASTEDLANLPAGTYSVTVEESNGCTATASATVANASPSIAISGSASPNTACSAANGSVDIAVAPAGSYTFNWSNGASTEDLANLPAGTYAVTATSVGTCTDTASFVVANNPVPVTFDTEIAPDSCGMNVGQAAVEDETGASPFTYLWSNGSANPEIENLAAGTITVTVTGSNGCTATASVVVPGVTVSLSLSGVATPNTACSTANGSINLTVTPPGGYSYAWSNGSTMQNISNLAAGSYSVTVSAGGTCTASASFSVTDLPDVSSLATSVTASACDLPNGAVDLTASGGVAPLAFLWSNGASTQDLASVAADTYSVTATGANGCTATATATVPNNNFSITFSWTSTPNTSCTGNGNGTLSITPNPAVPPAGLSYSFTWSNGDMGPNITGLSSGNYTVTVSAGGSCTMQGGVAVANDPDEPVLSQVVTPAICGQSNGDIDLTVSGATLPYTYLWSSGETSEDLTDILPGNYSVTVSGGNDCTASELINVPNNSTTFTLSGDVSPVTSCIFGNGEIDLNISPPDAYSILWSNGETSEDIDNLAVGTYSVTVTQAGSCVASASFQVEDETTFPVLSQATTAAVCGLPNGGIDLTTTGGEAPYDFSWSDGSTSEDLANVPSGSYGVTVTGANGCSETASVTVPENAIAFSLSGTAEPNTTCSLPDGSIDLDVVPAGLPGGLNYDYSWSGGEASQDLAGIPAGIYLVTVSVGAGGVCVEVASFSVAEQAHVPVLSQSVSPDSCSQNTGGVDLTVAAGAAPFSFFWSNNQATEDLANLAAGNYAVTVTGTNGCTASATFAVPSASFSPNISGVATPNTLCNASNGAVSLTVSPTLPGSWSGYDFVWSIGFLQQNLEGVVAGNYSVTVSAGTAGCASEAIFTVDEAAVFPQISQSITPAICGQANGAIYLSVSGGVAPYSFLWSNNASSEDLIAILPASYSVTVTGANGCETTASFNVPNNSSSFSLAADPTPNTLCGGSNGSVNLTVSPSAPGGYTFLWSTGATSEDLANLAPGEYSVTVTEGGSCSAFATYQVENESAAPVFSQIIQATTCGQTNGGIDLAPAQAGTNSFLWSTGETTEDLSGIPPGDYSVTVTGINGCTATATAAVPDVQLSVSLSADILPNTLCQGSNGSLALTPSPAGSYGYLWSSGATTPSLYNLAAGSYSVTVSIAGNCTSTASFEVPASPVSPVLSKNIQAATCGQSNGAVDLSVTGAASPFSFQWTNPDGSAGATTEDLSGIAPGNYLVSVTDAIGCTATATAAVPDNPIVFSLDASTVANASCTASNGSIDLTVSPSAAGGYIFLWSNNETTEDLAGIIGGSYSVTVSAGGSCTDVGSFNVGNDIPAPTATGSVAGDLCGEASGSISLTVSGGEAPYSFFWSNSETSQNLGNLAAGDYPVTVTGANGCAAAAVFTVPAETFSMGLFGSPEASTACLGGSGSISVTLHPAAPPTNSSYQFLWSNGMTSQDLDNLPAGNFSVTVSAGTCVASADFEVTSAPVLPQFSENITPASCGASNGSIDLTVSGGVAPFLFTWSNGGVSDELTDLPTGTYDVTVSGSNGCSETASFVVPGGAGAPGLNGMASPNTACPGPVAGGGNGGVSLSVSPPGNYTFLWSNDSTSQNLENVPTGSYSVTVSAGGNCSATASYVIENQPLFPMISTLATPAVCGENNGGVDLTVSGGAAPFSFLWSNGNLTEDLAAVVPGSYSVTITGSNGCIATAVDTVPDNLVSILLTGTATPDFSCIAENGSVNLGIQQPGNFSILWSNGAVTEDLAGVPPGNYQVTVSQGVTCAASASFTVANGVVLPSASATPTPAICGENNGGIQLLATGGTPPFTFLWSNGATTQDLFVIPAGTYFATVTDANGCTAIASAQVVLATNLMASISQTVSYGGFGVSCTGAADGSVEAQWVGGQAPFSVLWSNGSTTSSIDNLPPGSYLLTLTDGAGCSATAEISLTAPPPFSFLATPQAPACPGERGSIGVSVQGATGPFLFSLDGAPFQQVDFFENVEPGEHFLLAQDANGCEQAAQEEVPEAEPLSLILLAGGDTVIALGNSLELSWQANFQPDSLAWFASQDSICGSCQNPVVQPEKMQTYRLTAFAGGCFAEAELHVFVKKERKVFFPNVFSPNGDGVNDFFNVYTGQEVRQVNSLLLFDRWGELVYIQMPPTPNDPASGWDGTFKGQSLGSAVFVFLCEVEFVDGQTEVLEGEVTLLR